MNTVTIESAPEHTSQGTPGREYARAKLHQMMVEARTDPSHTRRADACLWALTATDNPVPADLPDGSQHTDVLTKWLEALRKAVHLSTVQSSRERRIEVDGRIRSIEWALDRSETALRTLGDLAAQ